MKRVPWYLLILVVLTACGGQSSGSTTAGGQALQPSPVTENSPTPGTLDSRFGTSGYVTTSFGTSAAKMSRLLLQQDGKIVAVGTTVNGGKNEYVLARHLPDGALDRSFGIGGTARMLPAPNGGEIGGATLQEDGKIIVVGYSLNGTSNDMTVVRFNSDGTPDTAWGNPGNLLSTDARNEIGMGVTLQQDGKVLVVGSASSGTDADFLVARLTRNGTLDESFGTNGIVRISVRSAEGTNTLSIGQHVAALPDGKIMVAGTICRSNATETTYESTTFRCRSDGSLDTSFGLSGLATTVPGFLTSYLLQRDGKTCLGTYQRIAASYQFHRLDEAGVLDPTFGIGGRVETARPLDIMAMAEDPLGRIVGAGQNPADFSVIVLRMARSGAMDPTFGTGGIVATAISSFDAAMAVAIEESGKILAGGFTGENAAATRFLLLRYNP